MILSASMILDRLLDWLALLGRSASFKGIELVVLIPDVAMVPGPGLPQLVIVPLE